MKRALVMILMFLVACGHASAGDYVRLETDEVYVGATQEITFNIERTCPDPDMILGASNGFVMTATGGATWTFEDFIKYHNTDWWNIDGLLLTNGIDGSSPDTFLVGGAAVPPGGMPVVSSDEPYFGIALEIGCGLGEICIDSAHAFANGAWEWVDLTCGQGGAPDRPLFLCGTNGDDIHPCCIVIWELVCTNPYIDVTPTGNVLEVGICDTATFQFDADPGMDGLWPAAIIGWEVISGIGTINDTGFYSASVPPGGGGDYEVVIEVENSCLCHFDDYTFTVRFTNSDPYFTNCLNNCSANWFKIPMGYGFSRPLFVTDPDSCNEVSLEIIGVETSGETFYGTVSLEGNLLVVSTTLADGGVEFCVEVIAVDGHGGTDTCEIGYQVCCFECGNVDHLGEVDIDDAVFLINYVFLSGFPPEPYNAGDVDCSYGVDIDDVVYLIAYIFSGGNAPCDPDGDAVLDCF